MSQLDATCSRTRWSFRIPKEICGIWHLLVHPFKDMKNGLQREGTSPWGKGGRRESEEWRMRKRWKRTWGKGEKDGEKGEGEAHGKGEKGIKKRKSMFELFSAPLVLLLIMYKIILCIDFLNFAFQSIERNIRSFNIY